MKTLLRPLVSLFVLLVALTGLAYPLLVTALGQWLFPAAANGSLQEYQGRIVGSRLIGQNFADPGHFWGRPSATSPQAYNGLASGGSNLGPSNPALLDAVRARVLALRAADPGNAAPVPVDLVTASASGLDPDISPAAALYQAGRVARTRGLSDAMVRALIAQHTIARTAGILGESRVNVLELNLALEAPGAAARSR
jgi:K+-transporting ATPase ATPase C chain